MDMFMDKLAQRLNAQEMIDANTAADVEELSRLRGRIKEYDECLERLQKLLEGNLSTAENMRTAVVGIDDLLQEGRTQLQAVRDMGNLELQRAADAGGTQMQRMAEESNAQVKKLVQEQTREFQKYAEEADGQMRKAVGEHSVRFQKMTEECSAQMSRIAVEATVQMQELLTESTSQLDKLSEESVKLMRECRAASQDDEELKKKLQEKLDGAGEAVHKECVKVYRNVQAVILEESGKQVQRLQESAAAVKGKVTAAVWLAAAAFLVSAAGVALQVLALLNYL